MNVTTIMDVVATSAHLRRDGGNERPITHVLAECAERAVTWCKAGVQLGDVIELQGLRGADLLENMLTALSCGAHALPTAQTASESADLASWHYDGTLTERFAARSQLLRDVPASVVHRTSGSTGEPCFAIRSAHSLAMEGRRFGAAYGWGPGTRVLLPLPLEHSFGWGALVGALLNGCSADLRSGFAPTRIARALDEGFTDAVVLTTSMAAILAQCAGSPTDLPLLAIAGAGPVTASLAKTFRIRFGVGLARNYGSTETGATFAASASAPPRCIGQPMLGVEILEPAPGEEGELVLRLTPPMDGVVTLECFNGLKPAVRRTGDLVRRDADDSVIVLARLDDRLRVNGKMVNRNAVQERLLAIDGVDDVYVTARPRGSTPEIAEMVAIVATSTLTPQQVFALLQGRLPVEERPVVAMCVLALPRDAVGKLARAKIDELLANGTREQFWPRPRYR